MPKPGKKDYKVPDILKIPEELRVPDIMFPRYRNTGGLLPCRRHGHGTGGLVSCIDLDNYPPVYMPEDKDFEEELRIKILKKKPQV